MRLATPVATIAMLETGVPLPIPSHISPRLRELLPEFLGTNILALDFIYIYIWGCLFPETWGFIWRGYMGINPSILFHLYIKKTKMGISWGFPPADRCAT